MKKYAVIVAGGKGSRMLSEIPKQFLNLNGTPILMHTINRFKALDDVDIILVLPQNQIDLWNELCQRYEYTSPQIVTGGKTRFESVKNGLSAIPGDLGLVAIHDGVRPFPNKSILLKNYDSAAKKGSGLTVIALKDSIRQIMGATNFALNRADYRLVQTPQTFQVKLIKEAYEIPYKDSFTDDASVFEAAGNEVTLVDGDYKNIKITTPEDILIAESILKNFKFEV